MAEIVDNIIKTINETNDTTTESILKKTPATTEGMLIAYTSLVVMALIPIFLGSFRSVKLHLQNKVCIIIATHKIIQYLCLKCILFQIKKEVPESMTEKDAMMFPVIASGALFSLYIIFRVKKLGIY